MTRSKKRCIRAAAWLRRGHARAPVARRPGPAWRRPSMKLVIQGVKTKATTSEISIPVEALMGIGDM